MQNLNTFRNEVVACLTRAGKLYGLESEVANVVVRLDIKGYRTAGCAIRRGSQFTGYEFTLRFHPDAIAKHYDEMVNDTIPHEVAHTVCQMRPELGDHHDRGWKRVCRSLGGDDSRTHTMEFGTRSEKGVFNYKTKTGHVVNIGPIRHAKLQNGSTRSYGVRAHGVITRNDYVSAEALTQAPKPEPVEQVHVPAPKQPSQNGSKAAQAREYIQDRLTIFTKAQMIDQTALHTDTLFKMCDFGTRGAARSCFVANLNKLA